MSLARLLYYPVSFMECDGNEAEALEHVPEFKANEWYCIERDDYQDMFKIWYIIGDFH